MLLFSIPFIGLIVWYAIVDPFMVVRNYKDYFPSAPAKSVPTMLFVELSL